MFLDAASCHFTADVLHACERTGLWVILISARLSWLVQPLDTHWFAVHKRKFLDEGRRLVRVAEGCDVPREAWLCVIISTAEIYLSQHSWRHAFEHNGLVGHQNFVSQSLAEFDAPAEVPPSSASMRSLFPRRRGINIHRYFILARDSMVARLENLRAA